MTVKLKVKEVRERMNPKVTQEGLAAMTKISLSAIRRLEQENQVKTISLDTIDTLCKALRCNVSDIIEYTP